MSEKADKAYAFTSDKNMIKKGDWLRPYCGDGTPARTWLPGYGRQRIPIRALKVRSALGGSNPRSSTQSEVRVRNHV